MLVAAKYEAKERYHKHLMDIQNKMSLLKSELSNSHFKIIDDVTGKSYESAFIKKRTEMQGKFDGLRNKHPQSCNKLVKSAILNLADSDIFKQQE